MMTKKAFFLRHLNDHIQYLKNREAAIKGQIDFAATTYHECKLGQWLYNEGPIEIASMNSQAKRLFNNLLESHQRFHELEQQALEKQQAGDDAAAKKLLTELHTFSSEITHILLELDSMT